jgi:hypothetical protein
MPDATQTPGTRATAEPSATRPAPTDPPRWAAPQVLDAYYFEMRWRVLSLAADLDRVERAAGGPAVLAADPHIAKLREAFGVLLSGTDATRAERVQMIFSDKTPGPTK